MPSRSPTLNGTGRGGGLDLIIGCFIEELVRTIRLTELTDVSLTASFGAAVGLLGCKTVLHCKNAVLSHGNLDFVIRKKSRTLAHLISLLALIPPSFEHRQLFLVECSYKTQISQLTGSVRRFQHAFSFFFTSSNDLLKDVWQPPFCNRRHVNCFAGFSPPRGLLRRNVSGVICEMAMATAQREINNEFKAPVCNICK